MVSGAAVPFLRDLKSWLAMIMAAPLYCEPWSKSEEKKEGAEAVHFKTQPLEICDSRPYGKGQ